MAYFRCGGGSGELHGASITVTCADTEAIGQTCSLYLNTELKASKPFSADGTALFEGILEVGTYTAKVTIDGSEYTVDILVSAENIVNKENITVTLSFGIILYNEGDECTDITGGWNFPTNSMTTGVKKRFPLDGYQAGTGNTKNKNTNSIMLKQNIGTTCAAYYDEEYGTYSDVNCGLIASVYPTTPFDLTNFNKIKMHLIGSLDTKTTNLSKFKYSKADVIIALFSKTPISTSAGLGNLVSLNYYDMNYGLNPNASSFTALVNGEMTVELDVSSINGTHYISCQLVGYFETDGANGKTGGNLSVENSITIDKIWLE